MRGSRERSLPAGPGPGHSGSRESGRQVSRGSPGNVRHLSGLGASRRLRRPEGNLTPPTDAVVASSIMRKLRGSTRSGRRALEGHLTPSRPKRNLSAIASHPPERDRGWQLRAELWYYLHLLGVTNRDAEGDAAPWALRFRPERWCDWRIVLQREQHVIITIVPADRERRTLSLISRSSSRSFAARASSMKLDRPSPSAGSLWTPRRRRFEGLPISSSLRPTWYTLATLYANASRRSGAPGMRHRGAPCSGGQRPDLVRRGVDRKKRLVVSVPPPWLPPVRPESSQIHPRPVLLKASYLPIGIVKLWGCGLLPIPASVICLVVFASGTCHSNAQSSRHWPLPGRRCPQRRMPDFFWPCASSVLVGLAGVVRVSLTSLLALGRPVQQAHGAGSSPKFSTASWYCQVHNAVSALHAFR